MNAPQEESKVWEDEEGLQRVSQMAAAAAILPMVMKTAIELDLFKIMAKVCNGDGQFTSADIVSHVPTQNPNQTLIMIERILSYLATKSILTSKIITDDQYGNTKKFFAMRPICTYFATDEQAHSLSDMFNFLNDKLILESWYHLKDAVLEGGTPFNMAHGENIFKYQAKDARLGKIFDKAMCGNSAILMKVLLEKYKGFEGVKIVVDVGGGLGATLTSIVSKYPNIKGINFDMPHVVKEAPSIPVMSFLMAIGVEHFGGDMFQSVPKGDVILMKWILHDWGDDYCIKLLKNCWVALPKDGKVIILEAIITTEDAMANRDGDMLMLALSPGGKERTTKEYEALARESGFASSKIVCKVGYFYIMEFYKNNRLEVS